VSFHPHKIVSVFDPMRAKETAERIKSGAKGQPVFQRLVPVEGAKHFDNLALTRAMRQAARAGVPTGLSRVTPSQAKPLIAIAGRRA
jgi:hypothetical protein